MYFGKLVEAMFMGIYEWSLIESFWGVALISESGSYNIGAFSDLYTFIVL